MIVIVIVMMTMMMMMMMLIDDDDDDDSDSDSDDSDDTRVSNGTPKQGHRSADLASSALSGDGQPLAALTNGLLKVRLLCHSST